MLAIGIYIAVRALGTLRIVFLPVFIAVLLVAFVSPVQSRLTRMGLPHLVSTLLTSICLIGAVGGAVWLVTASIGGQLIYEAQWDVVRSDAEAWLMDGPASLSETEVADLTERINSSFTGGFWSVGLDRVGFLTSIVGATILTIVLFFMLLKDGEQMWKWTVDRARPQRKADVDEAGRASFAALAGYARGAAIAGIVDGAAIGVALLVLDVPLALPLAVLTFFAAFFPIVGATVAGAVAVVVALVFNDPQAAIIVGLVVIVIQQVEGNLIVPVIMRHQVRLHPAIVLVALSVGAAGAGIAGAFLAVPLVAALSAAGSTLRESPVAAGDS